MLAALRLVRPGNLGVSFVATVVGGLVVRATGVWAPLAFWWTMVLAGASTALVTGGGNVLNDVLDLEGDRTNHPDRPLVTGEVSVPRARRLAAALFVLGVAAGVPVALAHPLDGAILAVAIGSLFAYEFRLKDRGLAGNALVALLTGLVFLYGGAAAGSPWIVVPFAGMAFLATLGRELTKDMEDRAGDVRRSTLPRTHGVRLATRITRAVLAVAIVLSGVPLLWFVSPTSAAGLAYLILVAAADGTFVLSVVYLPERLHYEQTMSKAAMTVALLAFVSVAFR